MGRKAATGACSELERLPGLLWSSLYSLGDGTEGDEPELPLHYARRRAETRGSNVGDIESEGQQGNTMS